MLLDEYYRADPELRDVWIALPGTVRAQILRLTEGDLATVACLAQDAPECPRAEQCATRWLWEQMDDAVNDVLDRVTLAMLAEVSRQRGNPECVL